MDTLVNGMLLSAPRLVDYFDPWKSNGKIPKDINGNHPVGVSIAVIIHSIFTLYVHVMCFSIALGTLNPGIELFWTCKANGAFSILIRKHMYRYTLSSWS